MDTWSALATPRAVLAIASAAAAPFAAYASGESTLRAALITGLVTALMAAHNWLTPSPQRSAPPAEGGTP